MLYSELVNINGPSSSVECGFGKYINPSYDNVLAIATVPLSMNTLSSPEENHPHPYHFPLRMNKAGPTSDILQP